MVQLSAAITLGLAGSALGAPTVKRHGLWCPPDQENCNGPIAVADGTVVNSKRTTWCPPDQENCNTMPGIPPVPLPQPLPDDDTVIQNAKRTLTSLCASTGLCDGKSLPPVVARYIQEQPDKRQDITCMAVGCPKANNVNTEKRQDVACMSTECETPDSLKEEDDQEMTCMGLDCPTPKKATTTTTTTKRADNNIACMAVGCPKPEGLDTSVKRDVKAQEAALALRDHVSTVPKAARAAVTCMAIGMCDPLPTLPGNNMPPVPMPTPVSKSGNNKRITTPYKGADAPLPWIDTLQDAKVKNKRIINPELLEQITKPIPIADQEKNKRVPPPDVLAAIQKYGSARPVTENRPASTDNSKRIVAPDNVLDALPDWVVAPQEIPDPVAKRVLPEGFWENYKDLDVVEPPQQLPTEKKRNLPATEWETIPKKEE